MEVLEDCAEGQAGAPVDDRGAGTREEVRRRVQAAAGGQRPPQRVLRQAAGHAGGYPGGRANEEPGVVSPDRARADEDRAGIRAQFVNLVEVLRTGEGKSVR